MPESPELSRLGIVAEVFLYIPYFRYVDGAGIHLAWDILVFGRLVVGYIPISLCASARYYIATMLSVLSNRARIISLNSFLISTGPT
jgi:hypothetical protein